MVLKKKTKKIVAFALSMSLLASAVAPITASASGTRTKPEKFGEDTYKNMFLSMYDDVITNGVQNGYLSANNIPSGGFGVPYHSVEKVIVEAPDFGHETTSEAMSYIVWMAAMRDKLAADGQSDLTKAWKTMEVMIPETQTGFMKKTEPSASYSDEWQKPEDYPKDMESSNTGKNPIHKYFASAYGSDSGLYLMHWLADVDNWYGYGGSGNTFTFINTFQRGEQESCFETIPHGSIEELKYGNPTQGIKGVFSTEPTIAKQWAYTNAPDAEGRAIQAIYWANKWGVGSSDLNAKAGKMADQVRNDMFDKYYKKIAATTTKSAPSESGMGSAHYLMGWYTSWGGALDGSWTWQIGASHVHQFYQNVMQAYAVIKDPALSSAMKATDAVKDWTTSLERQLQFYEWLQSSTGPFAGGATNSWNGRYEAYPSGVSTFNGMAYVEHPVYADPGSNGWIGNQVWSTQRIAELYYVAKQDGDTALANRCKVLLDKWVTWFVTNIDYNTSVATDGEVELPFAIPAVLGWNGQPENWTGTKPANTGLTCEITAWGSADMGCISSLANTLLHYAAAEGVVPGKASSNKTADLAYNTAKTLIDSMWGSYRDDIGVSYTEHNGSLKRIFEQEVWVPASYTGTMPNGDAIKTGIKFIDIRTMYRDEPKLKELEAAWKATGSTEGVDLNYHRFWHAGDVLMAIGKMASLFPTSIPTLTGIGVNVTEPKVYTDAVITLSNGNSVTTPTPTTTTTTTTTTTQGSGTTVYGDLDGNGKVDNADLVILGRYLIKDSTLTAAQLKAADVSGDGEVNVADMALIKQKVMGDAVNLGPR